MTSVITTVAKLFLDTGVVSRGYKIIDHGCSPIDSLLSISRVGSMEILDEGIGLWYNVKYEELTPLHGSGVDNIHIIMDVRQKEQEK